MRQLSQEIQVVGQGDGSECMYDGDTMLSPLCLVREAKGMADLHEVPRSDCLANIAVVLLGPEVCALHLNPHASAYAHLQHESPLRVLTVYSEMTRICSHI